MLLPPNWFTSRDRAIAHAQHLGRGFAFVDRWPSDSRTAPFYVMQASPRGLFPLSAPIEGRAQAERVLEHLTGTAGKPRTRLLTAPWEHKQGGRTFLVAAAFYDGNVSSNVLGSVLANRYMGFTAQHRPTGVLEVTEENPPRIILAYMDDTGRPA